MMNINSVGYIVFDQSEYAIHGYGPTVEEAWQMVVAEARGDFGTNIWGEPLTADEAFAIYRVLPASEALINQVKAVGGAIAWGKLGGVACTDAEEAMNDFNYVGSPSHY
jgi:hypothetical protein